MLRKPSLAETLLALARLPIVLQEQKKSTELPSIRGGVPVFSLPVRGHNSRNRSANVTTAASLMRPPDWFSIPI